MSFADTDTEERAGRERAGQASLPGFWMLVWVINSNQQRAWQIHRWIKCLSCKQRTWFQIAIPHLKAGHDVRQQGSGDPPPRSCWQPLGLADQPVYLNHWVLGLARDSVSDNQMKSKWGRSLMLALLLYTHTCAHTPHMWTCTHKRGVKGEGQCDCVGRKSWQALDTWRNDHHCAWRSTDSMMHSDLKYRWECGPDQPQKDLPWTLLYLLGFKQRKGHGQDVRTCSWFHEFIII